MARIKCITAVVIGSVFAIPALAEVTADEAKQLGGPVLTAWGAEKAGNKDGTIPEYTGALTKAPANWDPKFPGQRPDPFNEKPLFSITAQNAAQYDDRLAGASKEMFKRYPTYRMDVYPTHRTMTFPKYVLDNTVKNATACKAVDNELRVEGCHGGLPFPIPKTGTQVMWNHLLEYEALATDMYTQQYIVPPSGKYIVTSTTHGVQHVPFYDPKRTKPAEGKDTYWRNRNDTLGPARAAGEKLVVADAVDSLNAGRRAYQYIPGQRRVKLAPDLAYDTPTPYTGGSSLMDEAKVFLGAVDRYDFKLVGKKEKFIPYNTFNLTYAPACAEEKVAATKNFPNPDCVRWELHRVWVVEATLKPGFRHVYKRRVFYWDEDGFVGGMAENYDAANKLYRFAMNAFVPYWEGGGNGGNTFYHDLQTGTWSALGASFAPGLGMAPMTPPNDFFFSPEALAGEGIR